MLCLSGLDPISSLSMSLSFFFSHSLTQIIFPLILTTLLDLVKSKDIMLSSHSMTSSSVRILCLPQSYLSHFMFLFFINGKSCLTNRRRKLAISDKSPPKGFYNTLVTGLKLEVDSAS
uniref:Uncharacterized protein n=1 Tax=Cacopsylla melanoneura TaxID=428564 RepID=A0A8D8Q7H3_9HEMI